MRKLVSFILVVALLATSLLGLVACGNKDVANVTIGVMHTNDAAINVSRKEYCSYLEENIPGLKFIHSEPTSTVEMELKFMEDAYDMGCQGVMAFAASGREECAERAKELKMFYTINGVPLKTNVLSIESFTGCYTASHKTAANAFSDILTSYVNDGKEHGVIILSVLAPRNNEQQKLATIACLEALQKQYDLKYEASVTELATSSSPLEVKNDKGVNIYVLPGADASMVASLAAILQTNKYDRIILTAQVFTATAQVLTEYKQVNPDLKVAAKVQVSESASVGMSTGLLDSVVLNSSSIIMAGMVASIYNAATGNLDIIRDANGKAFNAVSDHYTAMNFDEYKWFEENDYKNYLADADYVKSMIKQFNKDLTAEKFQELFSANLVTNKKK